jgi:hypothetical protein
MGPHPFSGLRPISWPRLGRLGAADWTLAYCTDASGATGVPCDYSASLSQAWNDAQCDPNQSAAAGTCTDSEGTPVTGVPAITAVTSLASGAAVSAPLQHPITTMLVSAGQTALTPASSLTPVGGTAVVAPVTAAAPPATVSLATPAACSKTILSGICDSTLIVGALVAIAFLVVAAKQ